MRAENEAKDSKIKELERKLEEIIKPSNGTSSSEKLVNGESSNKVLKLKQSNGDDVSLEENHA